MQNTPLIIGALSAQHYDDRRQACRDTWASNLPKEVDLVFLVGDPQAKSAYRVDDVLYCPCPDNYESLPQKTRWFCNWALASASFDFLFKCDDDTYVAIDRLLSVLPNRDYVGYDIGGYASGGAGYLLSRRAAQVVSTRMHQLTGAEDVLVQVALAAADIPFVADSRFHPWNNQCPRPENTLITSHYCNPLQMKQVHRRLVGGDSPKKELHRFSADHPHWRDEVILFDDGTFARAAGDEGDFEWKPEATLLLEWYHWSPERLDWNKEADAFQSPDKEFSLRSLTTSLE
ncbi:hypothetical protein DTL42_11310 [Bremerella cremea]|uniref:Uncharacterized protein n=1 Tax=Bremerella cremea TaxID=1031537 RepID=A0A368KQI0_9BACT|nr:hypothetical protein [Bremerella cremea]RCS49124.1 hypothetical protein DTL42_11310 [Bremerella cremea]